MTILLKILHIVFSVLTGLLAGYSLISGATWTAPYIVLLLGIALLLTGIDERMKDKKGLGNISIFAGLFSIVIAISIFMTPG